MTHDLPKIARMFLNEWRSPEDTTGARLTSIANDLQEALDAADAAEAADDSTPKCTVTWFTDGGRTEKQCPEPAEAICGDCGAGRCEDHQHHPDQALTFYHHPDGTVTCESCDDTGEELT